METKYQTIEVSGGRDEDQNIEVFGDVLYTLINIQTTKAYFSEIKMNKKLINYLQRKFKGVSEYDLIKQIVSCKINEDNTLANEIITIPFFSEYLNKYTTSSVRIRIDIERR